MKNKIEMFTGRSATILNSERVKFEKKHPDYVPLSVAAVSGEYNVLSLWVIYQINEEVKTF